VGKHVALEKSVGVAAASFQAAAQDFPLRDCYDVLNHDYPLPSWCHYMAAD
jgi:hypothetical protein